MAKLVGIITHWLRTIVPICVGVVPSMREQSWLVLIDTFRRLVVMQGGIGVRLYAGGGAWHRTGRVRRTGV